MERKWYGFEVQRNGRNAYIGKVFTTLAEIRKAFEGSCFIVTGNLVTVLSVR